MCFLFSLFPATIWITIGYFVLYSAHKIEGRMRRCGQILAIWIFILAALIPICGLYLTLSGNCPLGHLFSMIGGFINK
jgi:hypothetical protein